MAARGYTSSKEQQLARLARAEGQVRGVTRMVEELYASVAAGFAIAFPFAWAANRYLIARGRGHALVHEHHH